MTRFPLREHLGFVNLVMAVLMVFATVPDPGLLAEAKVNYFAAVEGRKGALDQAKESLSALRRENPDHAIVLAYAGSAELLDSARTLAFWKKGELAKAGLNLLDRSVSLAPDNVEVRFLRAMSTFHLPGFFRRREQCQADFEWLSQRAGAAVAAGKLDRRLGAAALYHHGLLRQRAGDKAAAVAAWHQTVELGADTRAGIDAAKRLAESPQ